MYVQYVCMCVYVICLNIYLVLVCVVSDVCSLLLLIESGK